MYFIFALIIPQLYSQCFQKYKDETIYLSPNEVLKLDLQDYIYGKQLQYTSSNECIDGKLKTTNITLENQIISDYTAYTVCYDIQSGKQFEQTVQFSVKGQILIVNIYDFKNNSSSLIFRQRFILDRKTICYNVVCLAKNISLVDCYPPNTNQSILYILNATSQSYKSVLLQNELYGQIINGKSINSTFYSYYKLIDKLNDNKIYLYILNSTSYEISKSIYVDKIYYSLDSLNIYSFYIYNNAVYLLSKEMGLCYSKNYTIQYCWDMEDKFDVFSVFIQSNGLHSIILGSKTTLEIFKTYLNDDGTYQIVAMYNLKKDTKLQQIFHNEEYTLIIGRHHSNFQKYLIEIYTQLNDLTSNLYKIFELNSPNEYFYYDSLNNQAFSINNKSIMIVTPQVSYLTIDDDKCFQDEIEVKAYQINYGFNESVCSFYFYVQKIEEESKDIYDNTNLEQKVVVLNKSINNFYLNNLVIGPNLNYYLYNESDINQSDENDFEIIKFKENYSISYKQTMNVSLILFNRAFPNSKTNLSYNQLIQWKDFQVQIFLCDILENKLQIDCTFKQILSLVENTTIQQLVSGLSCPTECYILRQERRIETFYQQEGIFIRTKCSLLYEDNIQTVKLFLDKYFVVLSNQSIITIYKSSFKAEQCSLVKQFEINSSELESLISTPRTLIIFNVKTNNKIYNLYISTNLGLIILNPDLQRFNQVQLIAYVQFSQQFDTVLQVIRNRIIRINYNQIIIINLISQNRYYNEKILPLYDFSITNTTNSMIGFDKDLFFLQGKDSNEADVIIVYKIDERQMQSFYTYFEKFNNQDFSVISLSSEDFILTQISKAQKFSTSVLLQFKTTESKSIAVLFQGFTYYAKLMDLQVDVKTSEKQYELKLLDNSTQKIIYDDLSSAYIKLIKYNDLIEGSVSEWSLSCRSCPKYLELVNNINYNKYLSHIPNPTQIKHSQDYVFVQQEQSIIAVDNLGQVKFYIPLPIPEKQTKCTSIATNTWESQTQQVVSVCNTTVSATFYITSFLGTQPIPMGPFFSPIQINEITHIRMKNELLFILDVVTEYVYIFNLTIDDIYSSQLNVKKQLNAREFTGDQNQVFVSFDVSYQNETNFLFLITNSSQLVIYTFPQEDAQSYDMLQEFFQLGFTNIPSNIIPQSIMIAEQGFRNSTSDSEKQNLYFRIIIANQNYHHYEIDVEVDVYDRDTVFKTNFIRAYMQYGYFYANGKIRVSEQGFFGLIYQNPLKDSQKILAVYDRKEIKEGEQLRKILGGYKINSTGEVLFDFLQYKSKDDEFSYGLVLQDGPKLSSLFLSRYLAIKVKDPEFYTQKLVFNASNDFGKWVSFNANLFNDAGQVTLRYIFIILGTIVSFITISTWIYMRNKLKNLKRGQYTQVEQPQIDEDHIIEQPEN